MADQIHEKLSSTGKKHPTTMIESVYESLKTDILSGELAPDSKLRVERLRHDYGVGSSTMREALSRLVSDTLVTVEGQKGFQVAPVTQSGFRSISEMRKLLEAQGLKDSIKLGDDRWEERVVSTHYSLSKVEKILETGPGADERKSLVLEWEQRNQDFHDALVSGCQNEWLLRFRSLLYNQSKRYLHISFGAVLTVPRNIRSEHTRIKDVALDRNHELAAELIENHIDRTLQSFESRMAEKAAMVLN